MNFKLSKKSGAGTSLQEYFTCGYYQITEKFGPPNNEGDDYKVSTEWVFESDAGDVFTVYDYKETSLYDTGLPSVAVFRTQPEYEWHIGARDKISAQLFKAWLQSQVSPKSSSELFELAKSITDPRAKDGVAVLFESFRQDLKFAIMHGHLAQVESRIDEVLARYEKHVRELCGDVGVIR